MAGFVLLSHRTAWTPSKNNSTPVAAPALLGSEHLEALLHRGLDLPVAPEASVAAHRARRRMVEPGRSSPPVADDLEVADSSLPESGRPARRRSPAGSRWAWPGVVQHRHRARCRADAGRRSPLSPRQAASRARMNFDAPRLTKTKPVSKAATLPKSTVKMHETRLAFAKSASRTRSVGGEMKSKIHASKNACLSGASRSELGVFQPPPRSVAYNLGPRPRLADVLDARQPLLLTYPEMPVV